MEVKIRSLHELGFAESQRIILKEVQENQESTSWIIDDEGVCQHLRHFLRGSNIFLESRDKGIWSVFAPYSDITEDAISGVYYYYLTYLDNNTQDKKRKIPVPFGCVAIVEHSDGAVSRGYSYCSTLDNFSKSKARDLAWWRLKAAIEQGRDMVITPYNGKKQSSPFSFVYKAEYRTIPTDEERRLLGMTDRR